MLMATSYSVELVHPVSEATSNRAPPASRLAAIAASLEPDEHERSLAQEFGAIERRDYSREVDEHAKRRAVFHKR